MVLINLFLVSSLKLSTNTYLIPSSGEAVFDISSYNNQTFNNIKTSLRSLYDSNEIGDYFLSSKQLKLTLLKENTKIEFGETGLHLFNQPESLVEQYIIEFKAKSLIEKETEIKKDLEKRKSESELSFQTLEEQKKDLIMIHQNLLEKEHSEAINDFSSKLSESSLTNLNFFQKILEFLKFILMIQNNNNPLKLKFNFKITGLDVYDENEGNLKIKKEFYNTFNGVVLELSKEDFNKIKDSEYIKKIYKDSKVKASLYDSVPQISADLFWKLDSFGNDCQLSGNPCLTGKNIKLAIIDTGIDYTHPDLGGCFGPSCKVVSGYDFVNNDNDPIDDQGHGTHVAGIAAGNGSYNYDEARNENKINFFVNNYQSDVSVGLSIYLSGKSNYPFEVAVLYGIKNDNSFSLIGYPYSRMATSSNNLLKLTNQEYYFFVTSKENISYAFYAQVNFTNNSLQVYDYNNFESYDFTNSFNFNGILCNIVYDNTNSEVTFNCDENSNFLSFNKVFDKNKNSIILPVKENLPLSSYNFEIVNTTGEIIENHSFYFENNEFFNNTMIYHDQRQKIYNGLKGVAPDAILYAYKVLDYSGSGTFSQVISGIERAVDPNNDKDFSDRVDIMSLSLGGGGDPDDPVSTAIDNSVEAGVVAVVAAGNSGPWSGSIGSPGCARNSLTVGAVDKYDVIADFSSRGPVVWSNGSLIKPDVLAPGVDICSAQYDHAWEDKKCYYYNHVAISGTSMATPHVSGAVALLRQALTNLTAKQIKTLIEVTSTDLGYDPNTEGHGKINLFNAFNSKILFKESKINLDRIGSEPVYYDLVLENVNDYSIKLNVNAGNASDQLLNQSARIVYIDEEEFEVSNNSEKHLIIRIEFPEDVSGIFAGRINFYDNYSNNYSVLYSVSRLSELRLTVNGNHYPNFLVYNNNYQYVTYASQDYSFHGNSYTFILPHGEYSVYAINDFTVYYPEPEEYILMDQVYVPIDSLAEKNLSIEDARIYNVKARSKNNKELNLFEWTKGITIYPKGSKVNYSTVSSTYYDPIIGDRKIRISNKPENNLNVDVLLKYFGAEYEN
jgi:subtilisin family serine protease